MKFLTTKAGAAEQRRNWDRYAQYLHSVRSKLPKHVFEFAAAQWHYDPRHHWSLHDAWLEEFVMQQEPEADGSTHQKISLILRLLPPYHDGLTTITYEDVLSYKLEFSLESALPRLPRGHGDWLIDEVRLSENQLVQHEISFDNGATWVIECKSLRHVTTAPPVSEHS